MPFFGIQAQDLSNERVKRIDINSQRTYLDSLSIIENSASVKFGSFLVDSADYEIDYLRSALIWKGEFPKDPVDISYKVYPVNFMQVYQRRSEDLIQPEDQYTYKPFTFRPKTEEASIFGSSALNKTGSISRGIGFGNSQNLTVNSTLSLQLSGKLNDRISILASVTDDNIPIQPDGTTAQLQEFDRVFVQIYDDKTKLTAGDFFINRPIGYFTNYFKRAQGVNFETRQRLGDNHTFFTQSSAAISRGKFARNIIQGQEGNQGPYRLRGSEDEFFIIILAGTERVFIDGVEMKRGQENDYIIDYNTAEITFTARQLVNKDKRIAIDFQYSDAQYSRGMFQTSTGVQGDKYTAYINIFSEQDAKNQPLQQELTDADRQILSDAGDDLSSALAPNFSQVPFSNEQVLYYITDSLGFDSVFVRALTERPQVFQVGFSNVGQGNGDYVQEGFDATGRVYKWVAPELVGGILQSQGSFAPVRRLTAPRKNQIVVGGLSYQFSENTSAEVEAGFSNSDLNTFSEIDNEDNLSHAVFAKVNHLQPLSKSPGGLALQGNLALESIGNNFQPIEPYRSVEFNRDWNLTEALQARHQNIATAGLGLKKEANLNVMYQIDRFDAGGVFTATKNSLNADIAYDGLDIWFRGSALNTTGSEESQFIRHRSRVEKDLWVTKIGFEDEREDNTKFRPLTDSLSSLSYRFYDWQFYLTNLDTSKIGYKVFYRERTDFATEFNRLGESTHATHYGVDFALEQNPRNQLKASLSSRTLNISNPELTEESPERTLLMRLDHNLRLAKNVVTSNTYYELGAGLERRQEFLFIADPTGQGPFTWVDHNGNGIRELNEFEIARPEDGQRYVRVFTPTDDYVSAYSNQFSQTLNINPAGAWMGKDGIKKTIARFSNQSAFRIQRKTTREEGVNRFNPFVSSIGDSTLISQSSSIRNTLFFNRTSSKFGTDYTYSFTASKSPLTTGFEERNQLAHILRLRYNFNPSYGIVLEQEVGERRSNSDVIEGRNFDISYQSLKQVLSYQPGTNFRLNLSGQYTQRLNSLELGGEKANLIDIGVELRANKIEAGSIFGQVNYITINYTGEQNSSLAYEMLDGLQNGQNITWAAGVERTLGNNMQLSLNYNGRKSDAVKSVHTGSVQVRAFF